jgi:hypothetical protein
MLISSHNAMKSRFCCWVALLVQMVDLRVRQNYCCAASYQVGNLEKEKLDQDTSTMIFYGLLEIRKRNGPVV